METGYTEVYVWGSNHMGQLGLGQRYPKKKLPAPCVCSYHIKIRHISCGDEHTAFIASTGHLYTMGSNEKGRLGISDTSIKYVPSPCLVESLSGYKLIKVECGGSHTAVLASDYRAFTWGCGTFGALGTGKTQDEFSPIQIGLNNVRDISCGYRHTAFLTKEGEGGKIYITGANESGQLGVGNTERQLNPVGLQLENCRQIACGIFHTLILTDSSVYSMGGNTFGQLGIGDKRPSCRPVRIKSLDNAGITKVVCGHHSAALSDHGELYLWGTGVFGEYLTPHKVTHVTQFFKDIAIGACFGAAIDMNERLWTWGSNSNGELGVGDFDFRVNPYPILSLTGKRVKGLACGGSFAIALGEDVLQNNSVQTITPVPTKETRFATPSKDKENIAGRANSCVATAKIVRKKNLSIESTPRSENTSFMPLSSKKNLNISPMIKQPSATHNIDTSYIIKPPASIKNLDKPCTSQPSSRIESNNSYEDKIKSLEKQLTDKERQITKLLSALDKLQTSPGSSSTRAEPNPMLEKKLDEANAELAKEQELRKKLTEENRKLEVALAAQYEKQSTQREELRKDIIKRDEQILAIKQEYELLRLTLDQLSQRNQEFMKNISHDNFDKSELEDRIKELETAIQTQSQEISSEKQSLLLQISQLKASNSSLKEENEMLSNQLQDQSSTITDLTRIIQDWEKKYETLEKHSSSLKHAVDQMEDKNIRLVETMEKEIMVRARKYKERALNVLNTPTRVSTSSVMRESPVPPIALPKSVERYQNQSPNLSEYKSDNEGISPRLYILGDEEDFYELDSKKECEDIVFENVTVEESPCNPPTFRDNTFSSVRSM
jgi:alpha-tubulin suppressor-like RCC1 family protein